MPLSARPRTYGDSSMSAPLSTSFTARPDTAKPDTAGVALCMKRWLANPLQMGSIVPSSPALYRRVVQQIRRTGDEGVIELGAGTGVVSRALLEGGLPPERVTVVEIVPSMATHLRQMLPGVEVIEGDARALPSLIPPPAMARSAPSSAASRPCCCRWPNSAGLSTPC